MSSPSRLRQHKEGLDQGGDERAGTDAWHAQGVQDHLEPLGDMERQGTLATQRMMMVALA